MKDKLQGILSIKDKGQLASARWPQVVFRPRLLVRLARYGLMLLWQISAGGHPLSLATVQRLDLRIGFVFHTVQATR